MPETGKRSGLPSRRDSFGQPAVDFVLSEDGGRRFGELTGNNIDRQLAIVVDGRVQAAPTIRAQIGGSGQLNGEFSEAEASDLAMILRVGALPVAVTVVAP